MITHKGKSGTNESKVSSQFKQINGSKEGNYYLNTTNSFSLKKRRRSFVRGEQVIPPSGHLAPTIQIKNGKVYPVANGVDLSSREARKKDHPEDVAHWFIWLYQWSEKNPITDLWRTQSLYVPAYLVSTVKYMISAEKSIPEILNFIKQNKKRRGVRGKGQNPLCPPLKGRRVKGKGRFP